MDPSSPAELSENPAVDLPTTAQRVADEYPDVWAAFQQLGASVSEAGPLDGRTKRLVHLALAIGADSSGAVHSHARRGLAEGIAPAELEHVALLAVTTLGWPQAVRGLTWITDVTSASTGSAGA
jgi:alkylhydroperoxidase/carboxymuconolactone decarboxylase family protein YurZ